MTAGQEEAEGGAVGRQLLQLRQDLANLTREVATVRRQANGLGALGETVPELATQLQTFADRLAKLELAGGQDDGSAVWNFPAIMWDERTDAGRAAWGQLTNWVTAILGRVYDGVGFLRAHERVPEGPGHVRRVPECWTQHPDLVMELGWLCQEWMRVYQTGYGTPARAGDWHDRYWPGLRRRIATTTAADCIKRHTEP